MKAICENPETMIAVDTQGKIRKCAAVNTRNLSIEEVSYLIKAQRHNGSHVVFMKQDKNITETAVCKIIQESQEALKYVRIRKKEFASDRNSIITVTVLVLILYARACIAENRDRGCGYLSYNTYRFNYNRNNFTDTLWMNTFNTMIYDPSKYRVCEFNTYTTPSYMLHKPYLPNTNYNFSILRQQQQTNINLINQELALKYSNQLNQPTLENYVRQFKNLKKKDKKAHLRQ